MTGSADVGSVVMDWEYEDDEIRRQRIARIKVDRDIARKNRYYDRLVSALERKHGRTIQESWVQNGWGE